MTDHTIPIHVENWTHPEGSRSPSGYQVGVFVNEDGTVKLTDHMAPSGHVYRSVRISRETAITRGDSIHVLLNGVPLHLSWRGYHSSRSDGRTLDRGESFKPPLYSWYYTDLTVEQVAAIRGL